MNFDQVVLYEIFKFLRPEDYYMLSRETFEWAIESNRIFQVPKILMPKLMNYLVEYPAGHPEKFFVGLKKYGLYMFYKMHEESPKDSWKLMLSPIMREIVVDPRTLTMLAYSPFIREDKYTKYLRGINLYEELLYILTKSRSYNLVEPLKMPKGWTREYLLRLVTEGTSDTKFVNFLNNVDYKGYIWHTLKKFVRFVNVNPSNIIKLVQRAPQEMFNGSFLRFMKKLVDKKSMYLANILLAIPDKKVIHKLINYVSIHDKEFLDIIYDDDELFDVLPIEYQVYCTDVSLDKLEYNEHSCYHAMKSGRYRLVYYYNNHIAPAHKYVDAIIMCKNVDKISPDLYKKFASMRIDFVKKNAEEIISRIFEIQCVDKLNVIVEIIGIKVFELIARDYPIGFLYDNAPSNWRNNSTGIEGLLRMMPGESLKNIIINYYGNNKELNKLLLYVDSEHVAMILEFPGLVVDDIFAIMDNHHRGINKICKVIVDNSHIQSIDPKILEGYVKNNPRYTELLVSQGLFDIIDADYFDDLPRSVKVSLVKYVVSEPWFYDADRIIDLFLVEHELLQIPRFAELYLRALRE